MAIIDREHSGLGIRQTSKHTHIDSLNLCLRRTLHSTYSHSRFAAISSTAPFFIYRDPYSPPCAALSIVLYDGTLRRDSKEFVAYTKSILEQQTPAHKKPYIDCNTTIWQHIT